ncbi:MAG TPA: hypothetical protein VFP91_21045, partial [Vicinamibacterales bacterium]|nr:hypothetical protein [Vicinamibacterales bacterium]
MTGAVTIANYGYDASGRLAQVERAASRERRVVERHEYDTEGRKRKTVYLDVDQTHANTSVFAVEGGGGYSALGAVTCVFLYNTRERPVELIFRDGTQGELSRVEFVYDEAGHLVEETQRRSEDLAIEVFVRTLHRYDTSGRRVERRSFFPPLASESTTFVYNEHGDQIAETSESDECDHELDSDGRLSPNPTLRRVNWSEVRF